MYYTSHYLDSRESLELIIGRHKQKNSRPTSHLKQKKMIARNDGAMKIWAAISPLIITKFSLSLYRK